MVRNKTNLDFEIIKRINVFKLMDILSLNNWFTNDKVREDFLYRIAETVYCTDSDIVLIAYEIAINTDSLLHNNSNADEFCMFIQHIAFEISNSACTTFYKVKGIE